MIISFSIDIIDLLVCKLLAKSVWTSSGLDAGKSFPFNDFFEGKLWPWIVADTTFLQK